MTVTLTLWLLLGLCALSNVCGFLFGYLAASRGPADVGPGEGHTPPALPGLPRAGLLDPYPTVPLQLESAHQAQMARHERDIRLMTAEAVNRFGFLT